MDVQKTSPTTLLPLLFSLGVALAIGCGDSTDEDDPEEPSYDEEACAEFVVPTRFGFSWDRLNHRYSKWDHQLGRDGDESCRARTLEVTHIGGTFSSDDEGTGIDDTPHLKYGFRKRTGESTEKVGAARRSLELEIDHSGEANGTETFERDDLNLEGYDRIVGFVEGLHFNTDTEQPESYPDDYEPAHGYTMRGLGASVSVDDLDAETVDIAYRLRAAPGTSADREELNSAIPHAVLVGRLDILLVGVSDAPTAAGTVDYRVEYPKPESLEDDDFPPAPEEKQRVILEGQPEADVGLFGIRSFNFDLAPENTCTYDDDCAAGESCRDDDTCTKEQGEPGFYLREVTLDLSLESYDAESGEGRFLFNGYASNATEAVGFWGLTSEFTGRIGWIQTDGVSETVRYEADFETGSTSLDLADMTDEDE